MFSTGFVLISLVVFGVNSQTNNLKTFPSQDFEQGSLFGQFQHFVDGQNRQSLSFSQSDVSQPNVEQSVLISCFRVRPNIKNAHPTDNTKYVICRDEQRYEIVSCPNGGIFDNQEKACIDLCEQQRPCLNQGQCIILANLTLQCVCRRDWTGERCEIPLSTCASDPCGSNGECRMLRALDYSQDYVCICNDEQSYGRSCQQTVPNPCLSSKQQFHPFAYSRRAYINCDVDRIFFQPCNALLYWNQEHKRCDRLLPDILRAPFLNIRFRNEQRSPMLSTSTVRSNVDQIQGTQRFTSPSQSWQNTQMSQNQQIPSNQLMETTTTEPRVFHLQGFSNRNVGQQWQPKENNQVQTSDDFNSQSGQGLLSTDNQALLQNRNQPMITSSQMQMSFPTQNEQSVESTGRTFVSLSQSRPSQLLSSSSSFETSTVANNNAQQSVFLRALRGWKSNERNSFNQQPILNSVSAF